MISGCYKICVTCNKAQPIANFGFRKDTKRYRASCNKCRTAKSAEWFSNNREHAKAYMQQWREDNRIELRDYYREYRAAHKGPIAASIKRWKLRNPERWKEIKRINEFNRNNIKRAVDDGTVTDDFLVALYDAEICYYCNEIVMPSKRTLEHKTPLSRGGLHSASNAVMACLPCNQSKGAKTEDEYRQMLALKSATNGVYK